MARIDVLVLGAGIVGTSIALHLAERGLSVALVDRQGPGEATSFGNAGIIESETLFPPAFPRNLTGLLRVALKRAPEANYHLAFLPRLAPWLWAYRSWTSPARLVETARLMRPLFAAALPEHERLMTAAGAERLLRKNGWLKLYRTERAFAATELERQTADSFGLPYRVLDAAGVRACEPSLAPVIPHGILWEENASVTDPLALTRAYVARFTALGGLIVHADARGLHPSRGWRMDTAQGPIDAPEAVVALGPWAGDVLRPLGVRLPLAVKRGYHRHYRARGDASLARPVADVEHGYVLAPMVAGIRLTTGVEFADRDAPPTPAQFERLLPAARELFPLGEPVEPEPWMGCRPTFPDSRPVIGGAPGLPGLWLALGHSHWGLTLAAANGRLLAEMITHATPFCDPAPYRPERFAP